MPVADSDSSSRALPPADSAGAAPAHVSSDAIWLDGDVLACACPDCQAPMSVRLWLMVADCWRCGASIELTEEQERQALKLLEKRQATANSAPSLLQQPLPDPAPQAPAPAAPAPTEKAAPRPKPETWASPVRPAAPAPTPAPARPAAPVQRPTQKRSADGRALAAEKKVGVRARLQRIDSEGEASVWISELFKDLPCWLTSLVVHMVLIILLGLWLAPGQSSERPLILATQVNLLDREGDGEKLAPLENAHEFDDPGVLDSAKIEPQTPFDEPLVDLPKLDPLGEGDQQHPQPLDNLLGGGPLTPGDFLSGRDPRVRAALVEREGGTNETEAAVARGLKWLERHQSEDGRFSLDAFPSSPECRGSCSHAGMPSDTAGTALALLPFLGAGQTHLKGDYKLTVGRGLRWLVDHQDASGDLRGDGMGRMYAHGQAAIALCEAYALSRDETLREPAQRAIDFILQAQHRGGGWRYAPGEAGDLSVVGWQLMALRSAEMAYLKVDPEAFSKASRFLDSVQTEPSVGLYGYVPGSPAAPAMTAEGLLCRQYSGWKKNNTVLAGGVNWLLEHHAPNRRYPSMYYWYYGTQVMHHMGDDAWRAWNFPLRDLLVSMQETEGHAAGSWTPLADHDPVGGRLYMTALAVCTLEVYYRHLPLYRGQAVQEKKTSKKKTKQAN